MSDSKGLPFLGMWHKGRWGPKGPGEEQAANQGHGTGGEDGQVKGHNEPANPNHSAPPQMTPNLHSNPWAILASPPPYTSSGLINAQGTHVLTQPAPAQFTGHPYWQQYYGPVVPQPPIGTVAPSAQGAEHSTTNPQYAFPHMQCSQVPMIPAVNPYVPSGFNHQVMHTGTRQNGTENDSSPSLLGKQLASILDTPKGATMASTEGAVRDISGEDNPTGNAGKETDPGNKGMHPGIASVDLVKGDDTPTVKNNEAERSAKPSRLVKAVVPAERI